MSTEPTSTEAAATSDGAEIRPFEIDVSDEELADLRNRVNATRWPDRETDASQGVQLETIQALASTGRRITTGASSRSGLRPCRTSSPRSTAWTSTSSTFAPSTRTRCR